MTKEQMIKKVLDVYVAKYGKVRPVDALEIYNYIEKEVSQMSDVNYVEANEIADEAYKRTYEWYKKTAAATPDIFNGRPLISELFKTIFNAADDGGDTPLRADVKDGRNEPKGEKPTEPERKQCNCRQNRKWVSETEDAKTIKYLLPGVEKKDISIELVGSELHVRLNSVNTDAPFSPKEFEDTVLIDENMDTDAMTASLKLGILTINIPKVVKTIETKTIKIV